MEIKYTYFNKSCKYSQLSYVQKCNWTYNFVETSGAYIFSTLKLCSVVTITHVSLIHISSIYVYFIYLQIL